jgi:hypothetical protein
VVIVFPNFITGGQTIYDLTKYTIGHG